MPVSDRDRHDVFVALQASLGDHAAEAMMAMLPPSGWDDVATKTDLRELEVALRVDINRLDARIDRLDVKVDRVDAKIDALLPRFLLTQLGVIVAVVGLVWMIARGAA